ncbi:MAG: hypothetical protein FWG42_00355 [Clostridiales bacterium]|nr:hypothetical protein [Clostridiales bacterium]
MYNFTMQPMRIIGILDQTFKLYRDNFKAIISFSLLIGGTVQLVVSLLQLGAGAASTGTLFGELMSGRSFLEGLENYSDAVQSSSLSSIVSLITQVFIVYPIVYGGITLTVLLLTHGSTDHRFLAQTMSRYGKLLGTFFAALIICVLLALVYTVSLSLFVLSSGLFALAVFMVILAVAVLLILAICFFAYPVAIRESRYGFSWIGRALKLFGRRKAKTIGLLLLVGLLVTVLNFIFGVVFALFLPPVASIIGIVLVSALLTPIPIIAMTLLYLDIRITTEGYDLEIRAASLKNE